MADTATIRIKGKDDGVEDMLQKISRLFGEARRRVQKFAGDMAGATASLDDLADIGGEGERMLRGLADAARLAGEDGLAEMASQAADAGGALEGMIVGASRLKSLVRGLTLSPLTASVGALTVAVGLGVAAWADMNKKLEESETKIANARGELEDLAGVYDTVKEAALLAAIASGEMTEAEAARISNATKASKLFEDRIAAQKEKVDELRDALDREASQHRVSVATEAAHNTLRGQANRTLAESAEGQRIAGDRTAELTGQYNAAQRTLEILQAAQERYTQNLNDVDDATRGARERTSALAAAEEERNRIRKKAEFLERQELAAAKAREEQMEREQETKAKRLRNEAERQAEAERLLEERARKEIATQKAINREREAEARRHGAALVSIAEEFGRQLVDHEASMQEALGGLIRSGGQAIIKEAGQVYLKRAAMAAVALQPTQAAGYMAAAGLAGVASGVVGGINLSGGARIGHQRRR